MPLAARTFGQLFFLFLNLLVCRIVKNYGEAVWRAVIASAVLDLKPL